MRLDDRHMQSESSRKEKNSFPLLGIEESLHEVTSLVMNRALACMSETGACKI
jgi:hypothetical protein